MTVALAARCGGVDLRSPLMPASGTFSHEMGKALDLSRLAALVLKTTTYGARIGNPVPRVAETATGMLNSIGLPGKGLEQFIDAELPRYLEFGVPVVASISADTADQFGEMAARLAGAGIDALELNISCPNIEADGKAFAMSTGATDRAVAAARRAAAIPLWAKLTPNTGAIADIAAAAEDAGADAVVVANTLLALSIDADRRVPMLGNVMGGLSGPAVKPIILRMVYQCSRRVSIPVIGCGGISTGRDVAEFLLAGASAVQVGTASFLDPCALLRIEEQFVEFCDERAIPSFELLIGDLRDDAAPAGSHDMDVSP